MRLHLSLKPDEVEQLVTALRLYAVECGLAADKASRDTRALWRGRELRAAELASRITAEYEAKRTPHQRRAA